MQDQNALKSTIVRNQSQSYELNWHQEFPNRQTSNQFSLNSGRLTCRYNKILEKDGKERFSMFSCEKKKLPHHSDKFTNQLIQMTQSQEMKKQKNNQKDTFTKFRVNKSEFLEYLSFDMKINRNISTENKKIQQLNRILQRKTKGNQLNTCQDTKKIQKELCKDDKIKVFHSSCQKIYKYKSATSSPFIMREKHKKNMIDKFNKESKLIQNQNWSKNKLTQDSKQTWNKKNSLYLQVMGQKPKWKQFESWRRMRFKITIINNNIPKKKKQIYKNKQNL